MSKLKLLIPLFIISLFMISTYAVVADGGDSNSGDNQDHNGVSNQQEQADHRQVQIEYSLNDKSVQIQSENNYNGSSSHIQVEISANEGVKVQFEYSSNINNTETNLHIGLEARKLVEFVNNNTAVTGYDANDTLLNSISLRNLNWTLSVSNTSVNNDTVWSIGISAPLDNTSAATIQFNFLISNGYALVTGNNTLGPNALKWTVVITGYQFNNSSSQLALQMLMNSGEHNDGFKSDHISNQTEDHKDGLTHDNESQVSFGNGTTAGFYSWADNYTVDGHNETVITSPSVTVDHEDTTQNQMYFTFNQGNVITWDPKVGVDRSTSSPYVIAQSQSLLSSSLTTSQLSGKSSPGFELLAVIVPIGVIAIISKRKGLKY